LPVLQREHAPDWGEIYASHTFHEVTSYYPMRAVRDRRYKLIWNAAWKLDFPIADDLGSSATWQSVAGLEPGSRLGGRPLANFLQRPALELYDLQEDPGETRNLAGAPGHRERLERMVAKLKAFQKQTRDPWLKKWAGE
jgi:N-sulfoglucosamine sulfohydrolase